HRLSEQPSIGALENHLRNQSDGRSGGGISLGTARNRYCPRTDDNCFHADGVGYPGERRILLSPDGNKLRRPCLAALHSCAWLLQRQMDEERKFLPPRTAA